MLKILKRRICLLVTALVVLTSLMACESPKPTEDSFISSPIQVSSPQGTPEDSVDIVPFSLDKPIFEGASVVSGSGPAGVPIVIADVTFMGEKLGAGVIDADGTFTIEVPVLERNHMIGIQLGNLTGTRWQPEDFHAEEFKGEDPVSVAQVGFFYDTAMVKDQ